MLKDTTSGSTARFLQQVTGLMLVAIAYWVAVHFGLMLVGQPERIASVWPASGLALAILLLSPKGRWIKLLAVVFVVNAASNWADGNSFTVSLGFATANTLEPVFCAWVLIYFCGSNISFTRTPEIFTLFGVAIICNAITALLGAAAPTMASGAPFFRAWQMWWVADGLGIILITPVVVTLVANRRVIKPVSSRHLFEAIFLMVLLVTFAWLLFGPYNNAQEPLVRNYMIFPLLIWLAFRLSMRGLASALLIFATMAIWYTIEGYGVFAIAGQTIEERLQSVQVFLMVAVFSGLFLNTMVIERKRSAAILRESEERFRKMFERHSAIMLMIDPATGVIVDANSAAAQFYGWTIEQLQQMRIQQINTLPPETVLCEMNRVVSSERTRFECRHRRADDSIRDVDVLVNNITICNKDLLYAIINDITDRKRAEEALKNSLSLLTSSLESTADGILIVDRYGKITRWNQKFAEMWKLPIEILSSHDDDKAIRHILTQLTDPEGFAVRVGELYAQPEESSFDLIEFLDGRVIERYSQPQRMDDTIVGRVWSFRDITARKLAEEEKARLEAANRQLQKTESLSRLAGAVAHHFNNQLGVVLGNLEMAIGDLPRNTKIDKMLNSAMAGANRAVEISSLMLTYLGQTTGIRAPLDLGEICRQDLPFLQAIAPLEIDLPPSPGPIISANAKQIQQVLANLVTNAREASPEKHGDIYLTLKLVAPVDIPTLYRFPVDWQPQDNAYACLEVKDSGCGISKEDRENIFDPFFTSKFTGRGIGLPVVLGIVKIHGGAIVVESERGKGSTFQVFLPISAEESSRHPDKVQPVLERAGSATVLLVENQEIMRNMVETMIERLGFSVLLAKDGVEAVEVFKKHLDAIQVVLCDLNIPHLNGRETMLAMRQIRPDIPVILTSGQDEFEAITGDHSEFQVFLQKPYKMAALKDALMRTTGRDCFYSNFSRGNTPHDF